MTPRVPPILPFLAAAAVAAVTLTFCAPAPAQPVTDQPMAFAQASDGARVLLYRKAGPCVGQARFAEHVAPNGEKTPGCWVLTDGMVLVSFLDGERGNIPVSQLKLPEAL